VQIPDYDSFTYEQLKSGFSNLNKKKYPDRVPIMIKALLTKKPEFIEIVETPISGYRLIHKDLIPKKNLHFKPTIFLYNTRSNEYKKNVYRVIGIIFPLFTVAIVRLYSRSNPYRHYALVGIILIGCLQLLKYFFFHSEKTLALYDDHIELKNKSIFSEKKEIYYLLELRSIEIPKGDIPLISMYFDNKRELIISSLEPFYKEVNKKLKRYLSNRINYKLIMMN
jgi:hypothetical protein